MINKLDKKILEIYQILNDENISTITLIQMTADAAHVRYDQVVAALKRKHIDDGGTIND